jgi:hypothetical protein
MSDAIEQTQDNTLRDEVLKEYYSLQDRITNYDNQAIRIKSWSVTVSALAIGVGFKEQSTAFFLLAAGSSLIFWHIEALWKYYQSVLIYRANELEDLLNDDVVIYR